MRAAYRAVNWAETSLGPVPAWTPTLHTVLDVALRTRFPVTLFWGPQFVLLYNDAYVQLIGDKHPAALGSPAATVFPEIWDTIGPMLTGVRVTGQPSWSQDLRLLMDRHGFAEECFFTFSYSAVHGRDGHVEGIVDIAAETTTQVLLNRRLAVLATLTDQLAGLDDPAMIAERATRVLQDDPLDFHAVLFLPADADLSLLPMAGRAAGAGDDSLVLTSTGAGAVAVLPLTPASQAGGHAPALRADLNPHLVVDDDCRRFLRLLAATLTQAFARAHARQTERRIAELERDLSQKLQDSLLTEPARPAHLRVAVRYQAATEQAHIGGDWYDAFPLPDTALALVVGDVTGHDHHAAAVMAQLRNLLRGIAYTIEKPPALVLQDLEATMLGLGVDAFATTVLARVERGTAPAGAWTLRWSNAGHPHPMLLHPDGTVTILRTVPELLLGTGTPICRTDHTTELPAGSSLILYTDGLIERPGTPLDEAMTDLAAALSHHQQLTVEELCDYLLARYGHTATDDIVILVVRTPH
ncbi:hypothetical protein GCM10010532_110950 [Dactylosporangium siamense]